MDYGECPLRPFEIKLPTGTADTIVALPSKPSPFETSRRHLRLLHCRRATFHIPLVEPVVCVPKISGGIRIIVNYRKLNKVTEIPQIATPPR